MGKDTKKKEGNESPYSENLLNVVLSKLTAFPEPGGMGESDKRMNSSDVAAAVSMPKPGKERLHQQPDTPTK